jgi:hypothetical protein
MFTDLEVATAATTPEIAELTAISAKYGIAIEFPTA